MKLYDFDGMFDEKMSDYISKNSGKHTEEEWEDIIPALYRKFGDTPIKSIGKTPREFYKDMSDDELVRCLRAHLKQEVPVSEFLCSEIEGRELSSELLELLDGTEEEREYAMGILGDDDRAVFKYLKMLLSSDDCDLKDRCAEYIKEKADLVIDEVIERYNAGAEREYMLEIMSRVQKKRDDVFDILIREFRCGADDIPMHAGYLASYGDGRALKNLLDKIEDEGITFVEFQELKYAIEALGGEYDKERDFSDDPYYKLIHGKEG